MILIVAIRGTVKCMFYLGIWDMHGVSDATHPIFIFCMDMGFFKIHNIQKFEGMGLNEKD